MSKREEYAALCFRCEHRAQWWETKGMHQPRYGCSQTGIAVVSCYMYKPCRPVVLKNDTGDIRPLMPGFFSARFHGVRIADCELRAKDYGRQGTVFYWEPRG